MPLVGDAFARPFADAVERGDHDLTALRLPNGKADYAEARALVPPADRPSPVR
ncbi:hypothetical protein ACQP1W_03995 [Spirillospora sp. CA-255316]